MTGFTGTDALVGRLLGLAFLATGTTAVCVALCLVWLDGGGPEAWRFGIPACLVGGATASLGGCVLQSLRRRKWFIDAGGIVCDGPGDRRVDLRWPDVERVRWNRYVVEFRGGARRIRLVWSAVPSCQREAVRSRIDGALRDAFDYPRPGRSLLAGCVKLVLCLGGLLLYSKLLGRSKETIADWVIPWIKRHEIVRLAVVWNSELSSFVVVVVVFLPFLAWSRVVFGREVWIQRRRNGGV